MPVGIIIYNILIYTGMFIYLIHQSKMDIKTMTVRYIPSLFAKIACIVIISIDLFRFSSPYYIIPLWLLFLRLFHDNKGGESFIKYIFSFLLFVIGLTFGIIQTDDIGMVVFFAIMITYCILEKRGAIGLGDVHALYCMFLTARINGTSMMPNLDIILWGLCVTYVTSIIYRFIICDTNISNEENHEKHKNIPFYPFLTIGYITMLIRLGMIIL